MLRPYTSQQHRQRILQHLFQRLQERRSRRAIDHAVVAAHRQPQPSPHADPIAVRHRLRCDGADRNDPRLGWIDHGGELIDVEHPEIRDTECGACVLLWLEAAVARLPGQVAGLRADLAQRFQVRIANHRRDEAVFDGDRHADVHFVPVPNVVFLEPAVARPIVHQRQCDRFDDDVVERNLSAPPPPPPPPPPPSSPSCLLSASRASAARSMSISVVRKKCGTGPSEAASRLAIVLRIWVRGTSSYGTPVRGARSAVRGLAEAGAVAACTAGARSTSRLTTRPPGPEPCTSFRSTPASFAIRFASGDAFTRVAAGGVTGVDCAGDGAGAAARGDMVGVGAGLSSRAPSTFSPGFPIHATTFPTGTVLPSGTTTLISWPSARATSSMMALSVSTSASVSPDFTASPSCFVHFTSRPSSIVGESASMWTLVAIGAYSRYSTRRAAATTFSGDAF